MPEALRRLQWVDFTGSTDFATAFAIFRAALDADLDWVRAHTHLLQRALEWQGKNFDKALLLRGVSLAEAEAWGARAPEKEPKLSSLQTRLITDSRQHATTVQRRIIGAVSVALVLAIGLAVFAFIQRDIAQQQETIAVDERRIAEDRLRVAMARDLAAQATILQAQEGRLLPRSLLLAIESMRRSPSLQGDMVLRAGLRLLSNVNLTIKHDGGLNSVALSPDGGSVASGGSDGTVRLWDLRDGREQRRVTHGKTMLANGQPAAVAHLEVAFSPDGRLLATSGQFDRIVKVWNVAESRQLLELPHTSGVAVLDFSPDGKLLLTASGYSLFQWGRAASVWSVERGVLIHQLQHGGPVTAARFFQDGIRIATGSQDGTARLWSAESGQELARVTTEREVLDVAVSRDGTRLAAGSSDRIGVWNTNTPAPQIIWRSPRQSGQVSLVVLSPDGRRLATDAGGDDAARAWETASGRLLATFPHDGGVNDATFSSDGAFLATSSFDRTARVFAVANGREIERVSHNGGVLRIRLTGADRRLVAGSSDGTVSVWEPPWSKAGDFTHNGPISTLRFSKSGRYVVTTSGDAAADNTARVWDVGSRRELTRVRHAGGVNTADFSPDERYLATGSDDNTVQLVDLQTGDARRLAHGGDVRAVSFSPDGRILATASFDSSARAFDVQTGRELSRIAHDQTVWGLAVSSDGRWVASGDADGKVKVWTPGATTAARTFVGGELLKQVPFSPDARRLLAVGEGAVLWDVAGGAELLRVCAECEGSSSGIVAAAFAPDGETFATASLDDRARVWRTQDGKLLADLRHEATVISLAFSSDGRHLATGSEDKIGRVWEIASGREIVRQVHAHWVETVAFSPDGRLFGTGSRDGTARLEPWRPADLVELACARLGTNLSHEEWSQYLFTEAYRPTCPSRPTGN